MRVKPPSIIGSCYIWQDDSPDDYDWIPLKQDELLACIPEKHSLAKRKTFPVKAFAMVAAGLGITCTNAIIGESFKEGVRYLPLSPRQLVEIGIATPKKQELSPAAKRFAEFAREQFAQKQE